jgi:cell wall-associated NlpC family hydrolase
MTQDIIAAARGFLGVKFRHQGRSQATGFDCLGLLLAIADAHAIGWPDELTELLQSCDYTHIPDPDILRSGLEKALVSKPIDALQAGDIVLLNVQGRAQHLALVADYAGGKELSIIHAYAPAHKVVEHRLDANWSRAIMSAYSL